MLPLGGWIASNLFRFQCAAHIFTFSFSLFVQTMTSATAIYAAVPLNDKITSESIVETLEDSDIVSFSHSTDDDTLEKPLLGSAPATSVMNVTRLKALFFVTGTLIALASQYLLAKTMWKDDVVGRASWEVVVFSLQWSFWTCVLVFSVMICMVRAFSTQQHTPVEEDFAFTLEAHHIVGALLALSASWFTVDFLHLQVPTHAHTLSILGLVSIAYAIFVRCMTARFRERRHSFSGTADRQIYSSTQALMPTYQLLAATLGLVVGLCSQFLLSFLLWTDSMTTPVIDNMVVFAAIWSISTVIITFVGCASLRCLVNQEEHNMLETERVFLRMEAHYVFCALIGICAAWILMNVALGLEQQVLPSLGMLALSLIGFRAILHCFPEEDCLAEIGLAHAREKEVLVSKSTKEQDALHLVVQIV
jgi:uncharacterized protein YacL